MFHLGKQFIILIICGCVFLLLLIIGIIVFLNKPKPKPNANPIHTFVAVGEGSDTIAWSDDGIKWNKIAPGTGFNPEGRGKCVASNGNVWVVGGEDPGRTKNMFFSKDNARTWDPVTPPGPGFNDMVNGIVWDGKHFIAVGNGFIGGRISVGGTTAVWSEDGQNWKPSTGDYVFGIGAVPLSALGCNQEICVAISWPPPSFIGIQPSTEFRTHEIGTHLDEPTGVIIFSTNNGQSWTKARGETFSGNSVFGTFVSVNKNKHWVAISKKSKNTNILISSTGTDWELPTINIFTGPTVELNCVAHDNGSKWVVAGSQGIGYSDDNGKKWEIRNDLNCTSVIYNGKIWVASGEYMHYSNDGKIWFPSTTNGKTNQLCWNGTVWVCGGGVFNPPPIRWPGIRWCEDVTKTWNSTADGFFNPVVNGNTGVVHNIACRYKV